ncbi:MAG: 4Fe-4S binding protein [Spirochaetia bacterium]|nr:4Fe-4S binding protein [Spirochaetia bacterium]
MANVTNRIVVIDEKKCTGCGACAVMCPKRILKIDANRGVAVVTDENLCDRLRGCVWNCPAGAINIKY